FPFSEAQTICFLVFLPCHFQAREANHVGDRMSAERSSRTARTLNHVAVGLGIAGLILSIVYVAEHYWFSG
uniref:Uncharacterized protein n=1 Tax=Oreochromis niloticus TaxID=8128 RepID=A0A669ENW7_ORENI